MINDLCVKEITRKKKSSFTYKNDNDNHGVILFNLYIQIQCNIINLKYFKDKDSH